MIRLYQYFKVENLEELFHALFVKKTRQGSVQFFRYLFVGGFAAVVNLAVLSFLASGLHMQYLLSEFIAFIISIVVNYILSVWWIFQRSDRFKLEFILFTLIGAGGLGLNELVLWLCVAQLKLFYLVGEVIAILIVMIWNFLLRKFLFDKLTGETL